MSFSITERGSVDRGRYSMAVSYNRLFKMLIDRKMMKKELCALADVSPSTMSKMGRDEMVSMAVIARICLKLNCTVDDILEILPDNSDDGIVNKVGYKS